MVVAVNKGENQYLVVKSIKTFAYKIKQGFQILRAGRCHKDIWIPTDNFLV